MDDAISDLLILVDELIENLGADKVAEGMEKRNWLVVPSNKIRELIRHYFENEVFEDEFDEIMEETCCEFYNIAADNNYVITTSYETEDSSVVYYKTRIFKNDSLFMGGLFTFEAVNEQIDSLNLTSDGNEQNNMKYIGNDIIMLVEATPAKISERV